MSKKILGKGIEPKCAYCEHGKPTPDGANVLCYFCGVPDKDHSCKKFKYDPLKREPLRPAEPGVFSAEDFSL